MKKFLLSLVALLSIGGSAMAYESNLEAGTIDDQKWYTINSKSRGGCLTINNSGTLLHTDEASLNSYWRVIFPDDNTDKDVSKGVYLRNFLGKYMTVAGVSTTATKVYVGASREEDITDKYFVICSAEDTNTSGKPSAECIDASNNSTSVSAWVGDNIDGFSWGFSLVDDSKLPAAPEISTDDSRKVYKLISNRGACSATDYNSRTYPGGYFGIHSETTDATAANENPLLSASANGAYWYLTADEGTTSVADGVYMHNIISDQVFATTSPATMTESGSKVYLANVTGQTKSGGSNMIYDLNTYAISNATLSDGLPTGNNCMDQRNYSPYVANFNWSPLAEDKGDYENGGAWYFILATDEEVAAAEQAYISTTTALATEVASLKTSLGYCEILPAIFDSELTSSATTALEETGVDALENVTTVSDAISAVKAYKTFKTADMTTKLNDIYASAVGKELQFNGQQTSIYLGLNLDESHLGLWGYGKNNISTWWIIEQGETDGQYYLHNYGTDYYAQKVDYVANKQAPATSSKDDAYAKYSFVQDGDVYNLSDKTNSVRIFNNTTDGDGNKAYFYFTNLNAQVQIWGNHHSNTVWVASPVEISDTELQQSKTNDLTITLNHASGYIALADGIETSALSIKAVSSDSESSTEENGTDETSTPSEVDADEETDDITTSTESNETTLTATVEDGTAKLTLPNYGEYTITIPKGYFVTSDGKFTPETTIIVNLTQTTAISELEATNGAESNVIYDLMGHRVAQPTKGIYIINGKKQIIK